MCCVGLWLQPSGGGQFHCFIACLAKWELSSGWLVGSKKEEGVKMNHNKSRGSLWDVPASFLLPSLLRWAHIP